jgi:ABC-2 type transport system ATP-binding protein
MRGLGDRGKTVLVSSHILGEVQQVADTVTIIGRGRLLADGPVAEVVGRRTEPSVLVGAADPDRAADLLTAAGFAVTRTEDGRLNVGGTEAGPPDPEQITRVLAWQDLYVRELTPVRPDLEAVFLRLTADEHLGAPADGERPKRRTA